MRIGRTNWSFLGLPLGLDAVGPRLALAGLALLGYLLVLETSIVSGASGRPWWGIDGIRPAGDGRLVVGWLEPNGLASSRGIQPGDRVVGANGGTPPSDLPALNTADELRLETADGPRSLSARQVGAGSPQLSTLSAAAVGLFFVLAGLLVFVRATTRRQAQAFVFLCASAAAILVAVPAGVVGYPWAVRLTFIGVALTPSAFAQFFLVFPVEQRRRGLFGSLILTLSTALPVAVLALYGAVLLGHLPLFEWAERLTYANMLLGLGSGLALLLHSYLRDRSPRVKQRLRIAVGGTFLGTLPLLALSIVPKSLASGPQMAQSEVGYIVSPEITILGTVLIPLAFGYAILKHQFIAADITIRRSVVYLAVTLATTACYLLTISVFQVVYRSATGRNSAVTLFIAALLVALAAEPIRRWTQAWVERAFFSDIYAYRRLLDTSRLFLDTILSPEELVPLILGTVSAAIPIERLALLVAERDHTGYLLRWDQSGPRSDSLIVARHPAIRRAEEAGRALLTPAGPVESVRNPFRGSTPSADSLLAEAGEAPFPTRVLVPLLAGGEAIAVLALGDRSDGEPYCSADLEFLDSAATRFAVALDNALLHEAVSRQAQTDSLTSIHNHGYLLERLTAEAAAARRDGTALSVLLMDVDCFKFYNDTYGHPVGDQVLIAISQTLRRVCRERDIVGRYGGDEFVVILPETGREEVNAIAERINETVQQTVFRVDGAEPISLSVTIGAATLPQDGDSPLQLISAADVAMYSRKRTTTAGRTLPDLHDVPSAALRALLVAIQEKDGFVVAHSERAAHWAVVLAVGLGLPKRDQVALRLSGLLHDVGKLGLSSQILNKQEPLTVDERQAVERHVELGTQLIVDVPYQDLVVEAVFAHHERWDGLGYPAGLKGDEIPLLGRILAVADVYSAMTTDRPYRPHLNQAEAAERLHRQMGAQLDPRLVAVFLGIVGAGERDDEVGPAGEEIGSLLSVVAEE